MKNLSIKNYKNLKKLTIDSLGKINLIVGKNNVGKSTLLEAISIFASNGNINYIRKILELRGLKTFFGKAYDNFGLEEIIKAEINAYASLYSGMNIESFSSKPIEIESDYKSKKNKVSIKLVEIGRQKEYDPEGNSFSRIFPVEKTDNRELFYEITYGLQIKNGDQTSHLYSFGRNTFRSQSEFPKFPFGYISQLKASSIENSEKFDKIALTNLENELLDALRIIEPKIQAINFLSNGGREKVPMVILADDDERYYLSSMGDGINSILTIILAMLNCENGIFLVDEFDSGLHYSVQTKLWEMVYHLAEKLNIQVFATTHSEDCIKSFIEANTDELGKLIRLEKKGDEIVSVDYEEKDELAYIASSNIEVR